MTTPQTTATRPGSVNAAVNIQWVLIALSLISAIIDIVVGPSINDAVTAEAQKAGVPQSEIDAMGDVGGASVLSLVISLVIIAVFVAVNLMVAKGKQFARIISWVFNGIFLVAGIVGVIIAAAAVSSIPEVAKVMDTAYAAPGGWYEPWLYFNTVVGLLGALAVIVLLALPASHPFFRKAQPQPTLPPQAG